MLYALAAMSSLGHKLDEVIFVLTVFQRVENPLLVLRRELVLVTDALEFVGRVDEQHSVVRFGLLEHDDARGDSGAEEQVRRQLDHGVDVIVIDEVLADLLLGTTSVKHAGEFNDGGGAVDGSTAGSSISRDEERGSAVAQPDAGLGRGPGRVSRTLHAPI